MLSMMNTKSDEDTSVHISDHYYPHFPSLALDSFKAMSVKLANVL